MRTIVCVILFAIAAVAADPTVAVTGGQIRGSLLEKGGAVFKGIPYAQPPEGELRWRETQPVKAWSGVRDAAAFGAPCGQNANGRMLEASREDCLFLNVWTPEWPSTIREPVMVWFHGGGNYGGTASTNNFEGEALARHGVVLVSINYRLTIFGFFSHPELSRESPHHVSGNYGLMDQIAALQWVRQNIAGFGGDPANVTIFGQSAGAVDVNVLMTSPLAKGLFQKVIAESGTVTRNPDPGTLAMTALGAVMHVKDGPVTYSDAAELAEAEKSGERLGASLAGLRATPAAELLRAVVAPQSSIGPANGLIVDGYVLPKAPAEVFVTGKEQRVPLLMGNNARERTPRTTPDEVIKAMTAMYGALARKAIALYGAPDPLYGASDAQWVVDTMYRCPVVAQLIWHVSAGNSTYEYQFDRPAPGRESLGAVHGAEVPYVFGSLSAVYTTADRDLSAAMEQYWTNFAKTGNPNGTGLPKWPHFDQAARGYMEFMDSGPEAHEGLRRPFCDLYLENVKRLVRQR
jgi:para-nitrobenzyl esterase